MKKILIISPHFPPSNLAAVHRSRLFAQHLPNYNWQPIILMVNEKYYEEKLDWNLHQLLPQNLRIEKVNAFPLTKPRIIGDIGLRAFFQLYKKAKQIIIHEKVDFLYIPIPSFYVALLGRWLHTTTKIKYGIDYIDPWVHFFPGSNQIFSRHWFSTKIAKILEPIAVKKISLITGVAEGYYEKVLERNLHLKNNIVTAAMPYGGEKKDHEMVSYLNLKPYLFSKNNKIKLLYAGAMLPKAYEPLKKIFSAITNHISLFSNIEFHFIGTGKTPNDKEGYNIKPLAEEYNLWQKNVFEYPARIPYLDVLTHLNIVDGVFILGSTEPHYTPSKTYQAVLSQQPVLAVLHEKSTACEVLKKSNAGCVLEFNGEQDIEKIEKEFVNVFKTFLQFKENFTPQQVDLQLFEQYSAKAVTAILVNALNKVA